MTYQDTERIFTEFLTRLVEGPHTPSDLNEVHAQLQAVALDLRRLQVLMIPDYLPGPPDLATIRAVWPDETRDLPPDTEVVGDYRDWLCSAHRVAVWSAHFPPIPEFTVPPQIPLPLAAPARTSASDVMRLEMMLSRTRPPRPTHTAPEARASPPATTPAPLAFTHSRDDQED